MGACYSSDAAPVSYEAVPQRADADVDEPPPSAFPDLSDSVSDASSADFEVLPSPPPAPRRRWPTVARWRIGRR